MLTNKDEPKYWRSQIYLCFYHKNSIICSLVISVYLVIGASVFQVLEGPFEQQVRLEQQQLFENLKVLYVARKVLKASKFGIVELPDSKNYQRWNSWGSLFFAASVVSTIGYGNVVPATVSGRKFCIAYVFFGVPMYLCFVYGVGQWFTKIHDHIRNDLVKRKSLKHLVTPCLVLWCSFVHIIIPSVIFCHFEDWTFHESLYFCFITLSTVGFGDYVAGERPQHGPAYKLILIFWTFFGMALLTSIFTHVGTVLFAIYKQFTCAKDEVKLHVDAECQTDS